MSEGFEEKQAENVEQAMEADTTGPMTGTAEDQYDMTRIGKKQELLRNFQFLSVLAFTTVIIATWETVLYTISYGLVNGGLAGLVWMFIVAAVGMGTVVLSLAEMASMAPTSGGQYHWVSEFAPPGVQKFLSFLTGWLATLAWQTGIASGSYLTASQIQSLMLLNDPSYSFQRWHGTLLIIAVATVAICLNVFLAKQLPQIEVLMLILHFVGFFAIIISLWVMAPRTPAKIVFTQFQNNGGWPALGLSVLIGMTGPVYSMIASDCAVHMAEEIKDASRILPLGMVWSMIISALSGFVMVLTFCFSVGDIESALSSPTGQPYIQVFYNATNSRTGTTVVTVVIATMTLCNTINNVASASRQLYAFARDRGLPFASTLSYVKPGWLIPLNSIMVCFIVTCLLSLINIGSAVAFNAIVSLGTAALFSSYAISISCILVKRWRGEPLRPRRWSLGKWGAPVNGAALVIMALFYFFSFWPLFTPTEASTMNWSIAIYGAVVFFAVVFYNTHGKFVYDGPVVLVKKDL
ncbi:MAG: hypothetical protein L6R36_007991 [Xanthoria steineri]|nr:MAG: hypothetical protein L6R36_007991 [Xanthoria steineri]